MTCILAQNCEALELSGLGSSSADLAANTMVRRSSSADLAAVERYHWGHSSSADLAAVERFSISQPLVLQRIWLQWSSACAARAFQHWATVLQHSSSEARRLEPGSEEAPCGVPFTFCPHSLRWRNVQTGRFVPTPPDAVLTMEERAYVRECKAAAASERSRRCNLPKSSPSASRAGPKSLPSASP